MTQEWTLCPHNNVAYMFIQAGVPSSPQRARDARATLYTTPATRSVVVSACMRA